MRRFLVSTSLLYAISLHASFEQKEAAAEECYNAALYSRAADLYQSLLSEERRESWELRLAQCLYEAGEYQAVISMMEKMSHSLPWRHYLMGSSYNRLGRHAEAIAVFRSANSPSEEILFEEGLAHYLLGNKSSARPIFESLVQSKRHTILAHLYLAWLDLAEGYLDNGEQRLTTLLIDEANPLRFEKAYLLGEIAYQKELFGKAIDHFQEALPAQQVPWAKETLYHLGWSYLKEAEQQKAPLLFANAKDSFLDLLEIADEERSHLALAQAYLSRARTLKEEAAFLEAEKILTNHSAFTTREGKSHALLLRAQAAGTHAARDTLYRQLTNESNSQTSYYAKGWYLRGLNDFDEAEALKSTQPEESKKLFDRAATSFEKASALLPSDEASRSKQYQAQSYMAQGTTRGYELALQTLTHLLNSSNKSLPSETYYLHALAAAKLAEQKQDQNWNSSIELIRKGLTLHPNPQSQHLLGILLFRSGNFAEAEQTLVSLKDGDALFWAAKSAEAQGKDSKEYRRQVYEHYPKSTYAAEAYFTLYSYREYLQGDRPAIKHLEGMLKKYPESPYVLNAHYLIGLDYRRDRKSPEGRWLRKKDLNAAIDAFHQTESLFDQFLEAKTIPEDQLEHYVTLRYYAILERALCNLAVADESEGAKRQIFLEYAEEVLQHVVDEFGNEKHPLTSLLRYQEPYPQIEEECTFWLAKTYLKADNPLAAELVLHHMEERYRKATITKGYFLSRMWYEQGLIALARNEYALALKYLSHADDAAKGKVLNADEKLDLWIQQSQCYRGMNDYDNAILILTKVTNEDAISSLRLKAMYLRSEIYALQNRPELARNQLKALAKKGGEWAQKATQTLEESYGY